MLFIPGAWAAKWSLPNQGLTRPGRYDERVVWRDRGLVEDDRGDRSCLEVDLGHGAENDPGVVPAGQHSRVLGAISPSERMPVATW